MPAPQTLPPTTRWLGTPGQKCSVSLPSIRSPPRLWPPSRASHVVLVIKNLPASAGDTTGMGSIPGWGRSTGEENDNPLQYSCLGNPMDRGAWRATQSWTWLTVHVQTGPRKNAACCVAMSPASGTCSVPWLFRTVVLCPTHQNGTYLTFVARFWHLHRWGGEGSIGRWGVITPREILAPKINRGNFIKLPQGNCTHCHWESLL